MARRRRDFRPQRGSFLSAALDSGSRQRFLPGPPARQPETPGPAILGVSNLSNEIRSIPAGIGALIGGLWPGGRPAGEIPSQMGKGIVKSILGTLMIPANPIHSAVNLATGGRVFSEGGPLTQFLQDKLPEDYAPEALGETIKERGMLSVMLEHVGNAALAAGGVGAGASAAGKIATRAGAPAASLKFANVQARVHPFAAPIGRMAIPKLGEAAMAGRLGNRAFQFASRRKVRDIFFRQQVGLQGAQLHARRTMQKASKDLAREMMDKDGLALPALVVDRLLGEEIAARLETPNLSLDETIRAGNRPVLAGEPIQDLDFSLTPAQQQAVREHFKMTHVRDRMDDLENVVRRERVRVLDQHLTETPRGEQGLTSARRGLSDVIDMTEESLERANRQHRDLLAERENLVHRIQGIQRQEALAIQGLSHAPGSSTPYIPFRAAAPDAPQGTQGALFDLPGEPVQQRLFGGPSGPRRAPEDTRKKVFDLERDLAHTEREIARVMRITPGSELTKAAAARPVPLLRDRVARLKKLREDETRINQELRTARADHQEALRRNVDMPEKVPLDEQTGRPVAQGELPIEPPPPAPSIFDARPKEQALPDIPGTESLPGITPVQDQLLRPAGRPAIIEALDTQKGKKAPREFDTAAQRQAGLQQARNRLKEIDKQLPKAERASARETQKILHPTVEQVGKLAPALQPMWRAAVELGQTLPPSQAQRMLSDSGTTFLEVLRDAQAKGADPAHLSQFSDEMVQQLAHSGLSLNPTSLPTAASRHARAGTRENINRSLSAIVAGNVSVLGEVHTTKLLEALINHPHKLLRKVPEGGQPPPGWVNAHGTREGLLEMIGGADVPAGTSGWMMPEGVQRALKDMGKTYDNFVSRGLSKFTNPWRGAVLTASPLWYMNNAVGNFTMAMAQGVNPVEFGRAWARGWRSWRADGWDQRFPDTPDELLVSQGLRAEAGFEGTRGLIPRSVREAYKEARTLGGSRLQAFKDAFMELGENMQRANQFVDDVARTSVWEKAKKTGLTDEAAVQKAIDGLVNYSRMTPFERTMVRSMIPFYTWQKGILRLTSSLALDHTDRVRLTMMLGQVDNELFQEEQAMFPEIYRGGIPGPFGSMFLTGNMNPFADAPNLVSFEGVQQSLLPVVDIIFKRMYNAAPHPFGIKKIGRTGFAEDEVSIPSEVFNQFRRLPPVSIASEIASGLGEVAGISSNEDRFRHSFLPTGLPRLLPPARQQELIDRKRIAEQQVAGQLPLPPPQRQPQIGLTGRPPSQQAVGFRPRNRFLAGAVGTRR